MATPSEQAVRVVVILEASRTTWLSENLIARLSRIYVVVSRIWALSPEISLVLLSYHHLV